MVRGGCVRALKELYEPDAYFRRLEDLIGFMLASVHWLSAFADSCFFPLLSTLARGAL
jgi:hypothetical protein